jgi:ribose 5-phosphate isomerase A
MQNGSTNLIMQKRAAGEKAVEFIDSRMVVGLGTGSTVKFMIEKLAKKVKEGLDISAVSTSYKTTLLAESLGIKVIDLKEVEKIDLTIDGADEIDPELNGIKGGGGALLYEKIVAASSVKNIWIVDSTKYVERLGRYPLPIEIVKFGAEKTFTKLSSLGYSPKFRMDDEKYFVTDGGNYTVLNLCDIAIIGRDSDCEIIKNDKKRPVIRNDRP